MATPYYLVSANPKPLARIAKYARTLTDPQRGDPIIVVGSHRIVLLPEAVAGLLEAHPDESVADVLGPMGAGGAWPLSIRRLDELLAARDANELTVARSMLEPDDLTIEGHDWHVKLTRLSEAWTKVGGPDQIDWKDIRAGQIDTGYREHPCLGWGSSAGSIVLTDLDRNFFPLDFETDGGFPAGREDSALDPLLGAPSDGHGTRTGSALAGFDTRADAQENGRFVGFFGAAPRIPYIPVRISDSVIINHVQEPLALAIEHLIHNGCQVITLSMGIALSTITDRLRDAINYAYEQGVIFIAAAGNVWDPVVAPARLRRTIAVGGCTPAMTPWLGSSYGPEVDICAPAWPIRRGSVDRNGKANYGYGDGTSFATPQVAGAAALWLLHHGDEIATKYEHKWQRVEAFKRLVTLTAQAGVEWNRNIYGAGILDATALLEAALPNPTALTKETGA